MTREDIIRMAREAGFRTLEDGEGATPWFRFAAMAYAAGVVAEREACARVCDDAAFDWHFHASGGPAAHYKHCAAAIRARGQA